MFISSAWVERVLGKSAGRLLNLRTAREEGAGGESCVVDPAHWRHLPGANQSYDTVVVAFTARRPEVRERILIEVQRVLRDSGRVVILESLFSWRGWLSAARPAGLVVLRKESVTPFVHAFVFGKQCAL